MSAPDDRFHDRLRLPLLATGVSNLDDVLGGGLPELSFTIVAGSPGAGKTTLAHQIAFHVATAEHPALYFSILGEPTVKLLRYQQQFDFFDPERVGREVIYFDLRDSLRAGDPQEAVTRITQAIETHQPRLVIIDSFRAFDALSGYGDPLAIRQLTYDLALTLASWNVTSILVGEYREPDLAEGPEFTIADGILWLSQQTRGNAVTRKLQVMKLRGMAPLPGRHTFRFDHDGLRVYPHLQHFSAPPERLEGRAPFGIAGLDEMLRGGIPRGQACLVAGSSGTGKTLLSMQFILAGAARGEPGIMVTFEEHPQEYARKAESFGWDLARLEADGLLHMKYLRPVDLSIDEVLSEVRQVTERLGAKRLVLNGVSGLELAIAPEEREEFRDGLYRLVTGLTGHGVTVLLTTEVSDLFGDVRISTQGISFIADNIILLRYAEIESALRRVIMVIKMRTSDHDKALRQYSIDGTGVHVEAPFTEYNGILSGIPTLRLLDPHFAESKNEQAADEEALLYLLMSLHEADLAQLAESLNTPIDDVQRTLDTLVDQGRVLRFRRDGHPRYRAAMRLPGRMGRRVGRSRSGDSGPRAPDDAQDEPRLPSNKPEDRL